MPFRRYWTAVSLLVAVPLASMGPGCTVSLPRAPTLPSQDAAFEQADLTPPGMPDDAPAAAQLYPGDVVTIRLISETTEDYEGLVVDERGVLHVPLAGDVPVTGVDLTEAEQRVEQAMRQYDRAARASLVLGEARGHRASVLGAVAE
ncbi:MAG: polysaccharide biosynthesis/export family protein, partial [Myxococcota bacterium]|nr:polysaccharide biosynthesis/export family protein [Myxococcota bacterium]